MLIMPVGTLIGSMTSYDQRRTGRQRLGHMHFYGTLSAVDIYLLQCCGRG